jgi:thiol-disulfide isomerase/thioredoxin
MLQQLSMCLPNIRRAHRSTIWLPALTGSILGISNHSYASRTVTPTLVSLSATAALPDTTPDPVAAQIADTTDMAAPPISVMHWFNSPHNAPPVIKFGDGHVYMLDFTASWCVGCPSLYKPLTEISRKYSEGVRVILVTGQGEASVEYIQRRILEAHHLTLPIVVNGLSSPLAFEQYNIVTFPKVVVIDQQGIVRYRWGGQEVRDTSIVYGALTALLGTVASKKDSPVSTLAAPHHRSPPVGH